MRLMIDLQGAQSASRFRGIGRYTLALADSLLALQSNHEIILLLNGGLSDSADALIRRYRSRLPERNIVVFTPLDRVAWSVPDNAARARLMEPVREAVIEQCAPDILLITSLFEGYHDDAVIGLPEMGQGVPTAVVHYDLIPALNPEYLSEPSQRVFYERRLNQLGRADRLLAISEFSRDEAVSTLNLEAHRVINISAAVAPGFVSPNGREQAAPNFRSSLPDWGVRDEFVLYVPGGFDARKNFERLFAAYGQLPARLRQRYQLVIPGKLDTGRADLLMSYARAAGLTDDDLVLVGYVTDKRLRDLYGHTALFVFPSLHEGFGLPVLEAMSCHAPVIAANTSSLPEVVGSPSALFDPYDPLEIKEALVRGLTDTDFRSELLANATRQAAVFSWERTAQSTLRALEALHAERPSFPNAALGDLPERLLSANDTPLPDPLIDELAACLARQFPASRANQLLLDVTELIRSDGKSGIQRVVKSLLLAFMSEPPAGLDVSAIYFDGQQFRHVGDSLQGLAGTPHGKSALVDWRSGDIYLSLDLNIRSMPDTEPLMRDLARQGVRLCFVVFDLLPLLRPDWWPTGMSARFEEWLRRLLSVADTVCCISRSVADELEAWMNGAALSFQYRRPAVRWFHLGADLEHSAPSTGWPEAYTEVTDAMNARPTFLMVGTLEPRKGHAQALTAFEALWAAGHALNLVIVGKSGWLVDDLIERIRSHSESGGRLFWLSNASDECLEDLYGRATCLLAASEAEGFGLPLIESARRGLPILARDLPVFREVAGSAAYYFSDNGDAGLSDSIAHWLALCEEGKAPTPDGLAWLTWQQSASQLTAILPTSHD
ncbi:glycosyltransferase family 4 protein [Luminiphilus sp.]|nr:glycosyltransferase family 1 protein [Luminiphilus sp.]MDA9625480.1 glycosyltransferase family 4 protein [Luminiphilus sp.]